MFKFIDNIIDKIEGIPQHGYDREKCLELTMINLINSIGDNKKILLIGSNIDSVALFAKDLCELCLKNGTHMIFGNEFSGDSSIISLCIGSDIIYDPTTIMQAKNCDAIVMVEEKDKSKISEIDKSVFKIKEMGKEILGFVIV